MFSPGHQTADTVIERMVQQSPSPEDILVVTSDRMERESVMAAGAHTMSCGEFMEWSERCERNLARRASSAGQPAPRATLGDFFPEKRMNDKAGSPARGLASAPALHMARLDFGGKSRYVRGGGLRPRWASTSFISSQTHFFSGGLRSK